MSGSITFRRNHDNVEVEISHTMSDGLNIRTRPPNGEWSDWKRRAEDSEILEFLPANRGWTMESLVAFWAGAGEAFRVAKYR